MHINDVNMETGVTVYSSPTKAPVSENRCMVEYMQRTIVIPWIDRRFMTIDGNASDLRGVTASIQLFRVW